MRSAPGRSSPVPERYGMIRGDSARPGFAQQRIVRLMGEAVERLQLDLRGLAVLTEAASGVYACTPVLAAMAGARWVYAYARDTAHGSCGDLARETIALARAAGVGERVEILTGLPHGVAFEAQIVTNSGNLRPLDAELIGRLSPGAVVALMYAAWEFRPNDVDLTACIARQIPIVAVNERHPAINILPYLGGLAIRELHDAGFALNGCRIGVLCDNAFGPYILEALERAGSVVRQAETPECLPDEALDVILVAMLPRGRPAIDASDVDAIVQRYGPLAIVQFWGEIDRATLANSEVPIWPVEAPPQGQMALSFPAVAPDALVRMRAGGLRAAELVSRGGPAAATPDSLAELVRPTVVEFGGRA